MAGQISSWAELDAFLRASGRACKPVADETLAFFLVPGSGVRAFANPVRFPSGSVWLALSFKVCGIERLRLRPALVANAELPIGALTVIGNNVVVRQTIPLAALGVAEPEQTLSALATTATTLFAALRPPRTPPTPTHRSLTPFADPVHPSTSRAGKWIC